MNGALIIEAAGPAVTVQDLGRPGYLAKGLSSGGAMDIVALHEGAALLGLAPGGAALEMGGTGGRFRLTAATRIALTGAPMRATADGAALHWNALHALPAGTVLEIGACRLGQYGYLTTGGGIATPAVMGSRATHLRAGLGAPLTAGDRLPLGPDPAADRVGLALPVADRFAGGTLRVLPGAQTGLWRTEARARFGATTFRRAPRGSRLGAALATEGAGFALDRGLSLLSEVALAGDVQITGDGTPFILMADCQTTGGYPRIAMILPMDLPRAAQAAPGASLRFRFVAEDAALTLHRGWLGDLAALPSRCVPPRRDPLGITNLLGVQLVSGVTDGREPD